MDLLGDLNLGGGAPVMPTAQAPKPAAAPVDLLGDLFGGAPAQSAPAAPVGPTTYPPITCYDRNGLKVTITALKESSTVAQFKAQFSSTNGSEISNILFQVAVPKSLKLIMQPASGNVVNASTQATQLLKVENPTKVAIRLRIKLSYVAPSGPVDEIVECSSFDPSLYN